LRVAKYPGPNRICNYWWRSVKGFGRGGGSNFPFPYWLASSPLQHSRSVWSDTLPSQRPQILQCFGPPYLRHLMSLTGSGRPLTLCLLFPHRQMDGQTDIV